MRLPVLSWVVSVLALVGLVAWMGTGILSPTGQNSTDNTADIGGNFTLVDTQNTPVTDTAFRGKYMLVFFGFTHCPDICPTTLTLISGAHAMLDKKRDRVVPIFITVDPERDTPKVVGDYIKHFGEHVVGLTGSAEQIKSAVAAYKVYAGKVENENGGMGYLMDHSSFMYLMGPDGKYITHFPATIPEQALANQLATLIE